MYHSQDKVCEKENDEFDTFKEGFETKFNALKFKKSSVNKNEARCKTLVDE